MALIIADIDYMPRVSAQANNNAPSVWAFSGVHADGSVPDSLEEIVEEGYFDLMISSLTAGDVILVHTGGTVTILEVVTATTTVQTRVQGKVNQVRTTSGYVIQGFESVELAHASVAIAAVIADAENHTGLFIVKNTSASGVIEHTLTLASGTFDGTHNVATLNAPKEALCVYFDSAGNGTIIENVGGVVLS